MKSVLFGAILLTLIMGPVAMGMAQQTIDPSDTTIVNKYRSFDFRGSFAVQVEQDALNNYYLVDLSALPERFERVWFMNLIFQHPEVVNIDPAISRNRIWFQAHKQYNEKEVIQQLTTCKEASVEKAKQMTEVEKSAWLKTNDKY